MSKTKAEIAEYWLAALSRAKILALGCLLMSAVFELTSEGFPTLSWSKSVAVKCLLAGAFLEFAAEWISKPFDKTVSQDRADRETKANRQIADANASAAAANERTAQLGLTLDNLTEATNQKIADANEALATLDKTTKKLNKENEASISALQSELRRVRGW